MRDPKVLTCAHCGKPATCVGAYELEAVGDEPGLQPACDDCCGHGNEDGFCRPIEPNPLAPVDVMDRLEAQR